MRNFGAVINKIKDSFTLDWLTTSQREAFEKIQDAKGSARGSILSLYGKFGVGKTFLAWCLRSVWNCTYSKTVENIPSGTSTALIDDFSNSRKDIRDLLNILLIRNIGQVLVISRGKPEDDIWSIELDLTSRDFKEARSNLYKADIQVPDKDFGNLWGMINSSEVL